MTSHGSESVAACDRAVGACCHTTARVVEATEAENCNCNCRLKGHAVSLIGTKSPSDVAHVIHGSFASWL